MPENWSRWWSTQGTTHCVEVVPDRRFRTSVRTHIMNDLNPQQPLWGEGIGGSNRQSMESTKLSLDRFRRWYQDRPRIGVEWINTGSVWRRLPSFNEDYPSAHGGSAYCKAVFLDDLVVVDRINQSGVISLAQVEPDGTLERYDTSMTGGLGALKVPQFMGRYARIWLLGDRHPINPDDEFETFPELLYRHNLLVRPDQPPTPSPEERVQKAKKRRKKRKKRRKKVVRGPSIWERLMADDDG